MSRGTWLVSICAATLSEHVENNGKPKRNQEKQLPPTAPTDIVKPSRSDCK